MKKRFFQKHLPLSIALVIVAIFAWWIGPHHELMTLMIRQAGWWGPLVAIFLYVLLSLTPIPSDPLTVGITLLYGPLPGLLISWIGNSLASFTEFAIALNVENAFSFDYHKLPGWLATTPVDSMWFLIGVRFVPAIGGKAVAILAGMYHVSWRRFIWTTAVANLLGSLVWVLGGVGFLHLFGLTRLN